MLSQIVRSLGWIGFAVAAGYFILADRLASDQANLTIHNTRLIVFVSCALVVGGYILKFLSRAAGVGTSRCQKCGKRIAKNEMFCFDHKKESIWEAKERARFAGGKIKSKS